MLTRSDSLIFTLPSNNFFQPQPQFGFGSMMPRNTQPEIFTFERIPEPQQPGAFPQRGAPVRPRKRNTRVMYPAKVRKYLPPAEKSPVKRWLLILCMVVFMQIYTEEGCVETPQTEASAYNVLPFQSAEEQAKQMMSNCPEEFIQMPYESSSSRNGEKKDSFWLLNTTCPSSVWEEEDFTAIYQQQQSRRNGYVVALLYPVYHRLGSEN